MKIKIKEVYLPFLLVSIGTIVCYSGFRWFFDIRLGILPLKADLLDFWIPIALPFIPVFIWLRKRIRILDIKEEYRFNYQIAMVVAIAVPLVASQYYISEAPFRLVELGNVGEVVKCKKDKYFTIKSFDVKRDSGSTYATSRTSGGNNDNLNFHLYFSCPFSGVDNVWYGLKYKETVSNRIGNASKNAEYNAFWRESEKEFNSHDFQDVEYFEKLGYSDERDGFLRAIEEANPGINKKNQIILAPQTNPFEQRFSGGFVWIFTSFGIGAFVLLLMVIIPNVDQDERSDLRKKTPRRKIKLAEVLSLFNPVELDNAVAILFILNVGVFVGMVLLGYSVASPTPQELLEMGGNRRTEVLGGEYWRLVTSVFIHGGIMHLGTNILGLIVARVLLENILGGVKTLLIFLTCGILASLSSIYWHENIVGVGASGAILGLYGLVLAFLAFNAYPERFRHAAWGFSGLCVGSSLLLGLLGGVDNAAHFGGLISGFAIGAVLVLIEKGNQ